MDGHRNGDGPADLGEASSAHQALRREVNEQIKKLTDGFHVQGELDAFCECGRPRCSERVTIAVAAYEHVRRFPTRFLVLDEHVVADAERVVERHDGLAVVEKIGRNGSFAILADPRTRRQEGTG